METLVIISYVYGTSKFLSLLFDYQVVDLNESGQLIRLYSYFKMLYFN